MRRGCWIRRKCPDGSWSSHTIPGRWLCSWDKGAEVILGPKLSWYSTWWIWKTCFRISKNQEQLNALELLQQHESSLSTKVLRIGMGTRRKFNIFKLCFWLKLHSRILTMIIHYSGGFFSNLTAKCLCWGLSHGTTLWNSALVARQMDGYISESSHRYPKSSY